ncbi:hypothetical protein SKAU_G00013880 [Synaphobranchus kaupii]|uniref:Uncharacterized protein n=1 Tax=Synaphobranchus kaupii TaxID=118154 RepID=A0A9Q1JD84_SYNKA|nr:hypothetical protein SKAU_G00013880 [Synaphobranchus kaupii]
MKGKVAPDSRKTAEASRRGAATGPTANKQPSAVTARQNAARPCHLPSRSRVNTVPLKEDACGGVGRHWCCQWGVRPYQSLSWGSPNWQAPPPPIGILIWLKDRNGGLLRGRRASSVWEGIIGGVWQIPPSQHGGDPVTWFPWRLGGAHLGRTGGIAVLTPQPSPLPIRCAGRRWVGGAGGTPHC